MLLFLAPVRAVRSSSDLEEYLPIFCWRSVSFFFSPCRAERSKSIFVCSDTIFDWSPVTSDFDVSRFLARSDALAFSKSAAAAEILMPS